MKLLGAKFFPSSKTTSQSTAVMRKNAKTLWKQFIGCREQELNGESFPKHTENGTAFFHVSMNGQKKTCGAS